MPTRIDEYLNFSATIDLDALLPDAFQQEYVIQLLQPGTKAVSSPTNGQTMTLNTGDVASFMYDLSLQTGLQARIKNPGFGQLNLQYFDRIQYYELDPTDGPNFALDFYGSVGLYGSQQHTVSFSGLEYSSVALEMRIDASTLDKLTNVQVVTAGGQTLNFGEMVQASTNVDGYVELFEIDSAGNVVFSSSIFDQTLNHDLSGGNMQTVGGNIYDRGPTSAFATTGNALQNVNFSGNYSLFDFTALLSQDLGFETSTTVNVGGSNIGIGSIDFVSQVTSQLNYDLNVDADFVNVWYEASHDGVLISEGWLTTIQQNDFEFTLPEDFTGINYDIDWDFSIFAELDISASAVHTGAIDLFKETGLFGYGNPLTGIVTATGEAIVDIVLNQAASSQPNALINDINALDNVLIEKDVITYSMTTSHRLNSLDVILEGSSLSELFVAEGNTFVTYDEMLESWLQEGVGQIANMNLSDVHYFGNFGAGFRMDRFAIEGVFDNTGGILLTTGDMPDDVNDETNHGVDLGGLGYNIISDPIASAFGEILLPADTQYFTFTLDTTYTTVTGIRMELFFASEEFPEYFNTQYRDAAVVLVNGQNVALFDDDPTKPLSVAGIDTTTSNYIDNTNAEYGVEWDGFTDLMTVSAALQPGLNTIVIGITDTGDAEYDSALYIGDIELLDKNGIGTSILSIKNFEYGDPIYATLVREELNLPEGSNQIIGDLAELNGDVIVGFETGDSVRIEGITLTTSMLSFSQENSVITIDTDADGQSESIITFRGDFETAEFSLVANGADTILRVSYPPQDLIGTAASGVTNGGGGTDSIIDGLGNDTLNGNGGTDSLVSYSGTNEINGGDGSDRLLGGFQNDRIDGGADNDVIIGDASTFLGGSDTITGGRGDDLLMGGVGNDVFVFTTDRGNDTIASFNGADIVFQGGQFTAPLIGADFNPIFDSVHLTGFVALDASNVMAAITDTADGALFDSEGTTILFYGVEKAELAAQDFIFV